MGTNELHIIPENDGYEHCTDPEQICWCNPTITSKKAGFIVDHNAQDNRLAYEARTGKVEPNKGWAIKVT